MTTYATNKGKKPVNTIGLNTIVYKEKKFGLLDFICKSVAMKL